MYVVDITLVLKGVHKLSLTPPPRCPTRLSLLCKTGSMTSAMNHRHINVSNCVYMVLARLILDAIQRPINKAPGDTQVGSRKGYTTHQTMSQIMELHGEQHAQSACL